MVFTREKEIVECSKGDEGACDPPETVGVYHFERKLKTLLSRREDDGAVLCCVVFSLSLCFAGCNVVNLKAVCCYLLAWLDKT